MKRKDNEESIDKLGPQPEGVFLINDLQTFNEMVVIEKCHLDGQYLKFTVKTCIDAKLRPLIVVRYPFSDWRRTQKSTTSDGRKNINKLVKQKIKSATKQMESE